MPAKPPLALVVEDDEPLRALLTEVLADEGYSILQARDGEEAMQLLDELILPANVPCVMLLDMMLPDVSGVGVLNHLTGLTRSSYDGTRAGRPAAAGAGPGRRAAPRPATAP
jgi:DNA-binding response OmpR family regulator